MLPLLHNTLRRDRIFCVWLNQVLQAIRPAGPSSLRHLTDAQARDIGLSSADMERARFNYPSRTTRHPSL